MSRAFMVKQAPFKPTDIGGCQLWLDGADATTLTGRSPVTAWRDKSTNNLTLTATGSPTVTTVNGLNSLSFNGSSYFSLNPFTQAVGANYMSWFAVANVTNAASAAYGTIVGTSFTANYYAQNQMYITSGSLMLWYRITFGAGASFTTVTLNPGNVLLGTATNFTTGTYQVFQNGVEGTLQTNGPTGVNDSSTVSLQIGYDGFPGESFIEGTISELLLYTTAITTAQRQQVEAYLSQKWGLRQQLPQGHPGTRGIVYPSQPIPTAIYWRYKNTFVPSAVGTVSMWLDGADPAGTGTPPSNGSTVSTWVDKSGNGKNLTAVGTPTYVTASLSVYLNGSSYLQNTSFSFTNYTLFIVSLQTSGVGPLYTNTGTTDTTGFFPIYGANYYLVQSDTTWLNTTTPFVNGTTYIYSIQFDSLNNINVWSTGSSSPVITGTAGTITRNSFILGRRIIYSDTMTGNIFEVVQYNSDLGQTARQQVEGYLAWKWGLQANLPANHPYKNSSPSTTNPAGISRPAGLPIPSIACFPIRTYFLVTAGLVFHIDAGNPASYPGSGSTWYDLTTSGLNVTLYGGPTYSSANGGSLLFVPTSLQYGQTSAPLDLPLWTLEAWTYYNGTNTGNWPNVITDMYTGNLQYCLGNTNNGALSTGYLSGSWYSTSTYTITSGNWYHMVGTYDGTNVKLYVNGILQRTAAGTSTPVNGGAGFRIMRQWDGNGVAYWGGNLSIARMYNRALSADEVNTNYQLSKARFGLS